MNLTIPFHTPTFEDAAWCIPLLKQCPSLCCEYSFANMMMWREYFDTQIAAADDAVVVRFGGDMPHYLAPAGKGADRLLHRLYEDAVSHGEPLLVFGYEEEDIERLSERYTVISSTEHRDEFDYLYRVEDLATLAGRKYHSKRNHIAAFSREYTWQYEELNDQNVADAVLLADEWYAERMQAQGDEDGQLLAENRAIHELFDHRCDIQLIGGLIRVEGRAVAFTFGTPLTEDTFDTLVEKALEPYNKAYAVINREFARESLGKFTFVNRENDVGSDGLRRAKLSYHPTALVKKILCVIR